MKHLFLVSSLSFGMLACGGPVVEENSQAHWQEVGENFSLVSLPSDARHLSQLKLNLELELPQWPVQIRDGQFFESVDIFSREYKNLQTGEHISAEEFKEIEFQSECKGTWRPYKPKDQEVLANGSWLMSSKTQFDLRLESLESENGDSIKLAHSWLNFNGDILKISCRNVAKEKLTFLHLKKLFGAKNAVLLVPLGE